MCYILLLVSYDYKLKESYLEGVLLKYSPLKRKFVHCERMNIKQCWQSSWASHSAV